MIHKIEKTSHLHDVYFEDINDVVSSKNECYLINVWYLLYFSTIDSARKKAKELGISCEIKEGE